MQTFYHDTACDCARCLKAIQCTATIFGVSSRAVIYNVTSPTSGKTYKVVVNKSSGVITCNCPAGVFNHRSTCSHAQRAWLEYMKPDQPTALDCAYVPLSQRKIAEPTEEILPTAEEIFG